MTTLTEDIDLPGGTDPAGVVVRIQLWTTDGPGTGYDTSAGRTIGGEHVITGNPWSVTNLVGNVDIELPGGTVYRIVRAWPGLSEPLVEYVTVPTSGTWRVDQVLTTPPADLPTVTPSNERDYDEITADNPALAINGLAIAAVPNLIVTVPASARPVYIWGNVGVSHSVASANVALAIGATGLGSGDLGLTKGAGWAQLGAAGAVSTVPLRARISAGLGGSYQLYANGTGGNVTVKGSAFAPSSLAVLEV